MKFNFYLVHTLMPGRLSYNPVLAGDMQMPCVSVEGDDLATVVRETFQVRAELPFIKLPILDSQFKGQGIHILEVSHTETTDMELTIIPFSDEPDQPDFILLYDKMKVMTRIGDQRPAPHSVVINALSGSMIEMMQLQEMLKVLKKHDYI